MECRNRRNNGWVKKVHSVEQLVLAKRNSNLNNRQQHVIESFHTSYGILKLIYPYNIY